VSFPVPVVGCNVPIARLFANKSRAELKTAKRT